MRLPEPVITCPRIAIMRTTTGVYSATVNTTSTGVATATDLNRRSSPTTLVGADPYGNWTLALGLNILIWEVTDSASGLNATCEQEVTVEGELVYEYGAL